MQGKDIRAWRATWGITSADLAAVWGIGVPQLLRIERGENGLMPYQILAFERTTMKLALRERKFEMVERNTLADIVILSQLAERLTKLFGGPDDPTKAQDRVPERPTGRR